MGRMSALESNNYKVGTKEYIAKENEMMKLERAISSCIYMNKITVSKRKKIISILENLSDIKFDIGKVDSNQLLDFVSNYESYKDKYDLFEVIKFAHGEINPKNYGYNKINLME